MGLRPPPQAHCLTPFMNTMEQLGFDFASGENSDTYSCHPATGYDAWAHERQSAIDKVNSRFGAMINQNVRAKLWCGRDEYRGKLLLNCLLPPNSKEESVPLRIGRTTFYLNDIEYCLKIHGDENDTGIS
jgi:hypothetical protein